ncbi:MAG: pirin family protein [Alphaproteobacteria bacterium]|nr:pirin family protein [Alphaproteobacteria bacterium]
MSRLEAVAPECTETQGSISLIIEGQPKDLGGFSVRRVLPSPRQRSVGPFVFYDEMGPATFPAGEGIDVRPHPHIGLATITYMFTGEIMHRDSLGYTQPIRPGAVNWMTAGRGIVHSERSGPDRERESRMHGMQAWIALPADLQEIDPSFEHYPADRIPTLSRPGVRMTLIAGTAYGEASPVIVQSPMFYVEADLEAGARLALPDEHADRAAYVVSGRITVEGRPLTGGALVVFQPGQGAEIAAETEAKVMLLGGAPLPEPRVLWWNFVATDQDRIDAAKRKWAAGGFERIEGDDEFIPLPAD